SEGVVGLCWRGPLTLALAYAAQAAGDLPAALTFATSAASLTERVGGRPTAAECQLLRAHLSEKMADPAAAAAHRAQARALTVGLKLSGIEQRLNGSPNGSPSADSSPAKSGLPRFREEGDVICVTWRGRSVRVKATKG